MKTTLIMIDVDGVLADNSSRLPYLKNKNYGKFYDGVEVSNDKKIEDYTGFIDKLLKEHDLCDHTYVCLTTGRPEKLRNITMQWISANWPSIHSKLTNINGEDFNCFRANSDHRKSPVVKAEMVDIIAKKVAKGAFDHYDHKRRKIDLIIIDDDPTNTKAMAEAAVGQFASVTPITLGVSRLSDSGQNTSSEEELCIEKSSLKSRLSAFRERHNRHH